MTKRRIVYVINHAAFFVSHRLPLALAARNDGWDVHLIVGQPGSELMEKLAEAELDRHGLPYTRLRFRTVGLNLLWELVGVLQLFWFILRLNPTLVHTASPKGNLYGGIVSRVLRVPCHVAAISGMGFLFTGDAGGFKKALRKLYSTLFSVVYGHANVTIIVQNEDDKNNLLRTGKVREDGVVLIPGSGVELSAYSTPRRAESEKLVVLPARLLRDKGVEEFVAAARALKLAGTDWRFALVGTADYANPSAISTAQISEWQAAGFVEWWGHREDMPYVFSQADIVCLPSYREGMPKCLLEAAAAGCAVVTTDVVGCREAIVPGQTGDLVPMQDAVTLTKVLGELIADPERRRRYGEAGRRLAFARFGIDSVCRTTMSAYEKLLHAYRRPSEPPNS